MKVIERVKKNEKAKKTITTNAVANVIISQLSKCLLQ